MENGIRMLRCFLIHVGTNDCRGSRNLDWVLGEYDLLNTAKI
jgi:hypothetical protein